MLVLDDFNSTKVDGAAFAQILLLTYTVSEVVTSAHKDCDTAPLDMCKRLHPDLLMNEGRG